MIESLFIGKKIEKHFSIFLVPVRNKLFPFSHFHLSPSGEITGILIAYGLLAEIDRETISDISTPFGENYNALGQIFSEL